jgi:hypothetical protein
MLEEGGVRHGDLDLTSGLAIDGQALGLGHACDMQKRFSEEGDSG